MNRMSPLDASFIHIEDDNNQMHIGSTAIFEGPAPAFDQVRDMIVGKLPLAERYRQVVRQVPLDLGRPAEACPQSCREPGRTPERDPQRSPWSRCASGCCRPRCE